MLSEDNLSLSEGDLSLSEDDLSLSEDDLLMSELVDGLALGAGNTSALDFVLITHFSFLCSLFSFIK